MARRPDPDRILTAKLIGAAARLADDPDDEATIATLRGMLADRPTALAAAAAEHWAIRGAEGNTDPVRAATAARRLRMIAATVAPSPALAWSPWAVHSGLA